MGRVLLVEDDDYLREELVEVLNEHGFTVTPARHGLEALSYLRSYDDVSLVLLDLMMPEMDGWQFRQVTLKEPALAKVPVVILSAASQLGSERELLAAADYLQKPVSLHRLIDTVRRHCPH